MFSVENKRLLRTPDAATLISNLRYQPRRRMSCQELMYVFDGDKNGVIQYIGTDCGTKQWVNPVLAKMIEVKASSPAARHTDPRALVSGHFLRTSYAWPRFEGGHPMTWWAVDLGEGNRLMCNYYTVRHDGSQDFMRSWVLQVGGRGGLG